MKRIVHIVILALCLALSLQGLALGALGEMDDEYEVYMAWVSSYGFSGQYDHPGDDKPVITFSRDGRFIDAGLFKDGYLPIPEYYDEDGPDVDEADVAPGRGRYEIVDFTLILNYEDGRTRRAAFSLFFGDPAEESPTLMFLYRGRLSLIE